MNGAISMTGGTVIVFGPTNSANGALDYLYGCYVSGGYLLAAGSSGMAQAPDTTSTQYSVMITFSLAIKAGTLVHIETEDGTEVLTFAAAKECQSVVFCSPSLQNGKTYNVYTGGSSSGTADNEVYHGGTYSGGTQYTSFAVTGAVTTVGGNAGFPGGDGQQWGRR